MRLRLGKVVASEIESASFRDSFRGHCLLSKSKPCCNVPHDLSTQRNVNNAHQLTSLGELHPSCPGNKKQLMNADDMLKRTHTHICIYIYILYPEEFVFASKIPSSLLRLGL